MTFDELRKFLTENNLVTDENPPSLTGDGAQTLLLLFMIEGAFDPFPVQYHLERHYPEHIPMQG